MTFASVLLAVAIFLAGGAMSAVAARTDRGSRTGPILTVADIQARLAAERSRPYFPISQA
ncbi:hypothetical protein [Nocardia concava]|uniref:hypothetical protein n=1 Tax=Nocardia concava TaxID=257281 RepID=UPI00031DAB99|nr:hypothetical protein [Nocardia concava]